MRDIKIYSGPHIGSRGSISSINNDLDNTEDQEFFIQIKNAFMTIQDSFEQVCHNNYEAETLNIYPIYVRPQSHFNDKFFRPAY